MILLFSTNLLTFFLFIGRLCKTPFCVEICQDMEYYGDRLSMEGEGGKNGF